MELNIIEGQIKRPLKVVIYGSEGIGKTTVAAHSIEPLFIDTEGGTAHLNVRRIPRPDSWNELLAIIYEIAASPGLCRTLVLDTADWAEQMCVDHICQKYSKTGIEEFGYGKGYTYLAEEFSKLLAALDIVIAVGVNVIVIAHAKMRKQELPDEMGAFDRWEMKLSKQVAPLLKEWCDMLLFCNYQTFVVKTEGNNAKAQGGKRVMYELVRHAPAKAFVAFFQNRPADVGNRHALGVKLVHQLNRLRLIRNDNVAVPAPLVAEESRVRVGALLFRLVKVMDRGGFHHSVVKNEFQQVAVDGRHALHCS